MTTTNTKLNLLTVGSDAEMFLYDSNNDEIISAEGYVKGTKDKPYVFDKKNRWFTTQLDNVLAEITIPPAKTAKEFSSALIKAINYVAKSLPEGILPVPVASAELDDKYLQTEQAIMFGCEPDFNAYTMFMNEKPFCENHRLRSAGFHLHCGYDDIEVPYNDNLYEYCVDEQRSNIVKVLDLFVSIPLVVTEPDSQRKLLYGKAGAFRPKPYGLEYRTPSNFCMQSVETMEWAYSAVESAFNFINNHGFLTKDLANKIQMTINKNDKDAAKSIISEFNLQTT